jgi:CDP-diacylglycerol--glycerol-3-phosphate 3-phosphatidyltransferase
MAATQQGVVIAAGPFGKAKAVAQVGMVFALIIVPGSPLWLDGLVYLTVAITVLSGADYFFGLRRHVANARDSAPDNVADGERSGRAVEPVAQTQVPGRDLA